MVMFFMLPFMAIVGDKWLFFYQMGKCCKIWHALLCDFQWRIHIRPANISLCLSMEILSLYAQCIAVRPCLGFWWSSWLRCKYGYVTVNFRDVTLACGWLTRSLCYLIKNIYYYIFFSLIKPLEHFRIFTFNIIEKIFFDIKNWRNLR